MKRHLTSNFQGTIIVLTVLIAVTLGMTNPSPVLGGRPPATEYVVVVEVECTANNIDIGASADFIAVDKQGSETFIQGVDLLSGKGVRDIGVTFPYSPKYNKWEVYVDFYQDRTAEPKTYYCTQSFTGTNFPAILTVYSSDCTSPVPGNPITVTVTISSHKVFP